MDERGFGDDIKESPRRLTRLLKFALAVLVALSGMTIPAKVQAADALAPDFQEVYDLISKRLASEHAVDLNREAVEGLLSRLKGRAWLVTGDLATLTNSDAGIVTNLFDGSILRIVVPSVQKGLAVKISSAVQNYTGTNGLDGIVLDLRYASGDDYAEAAAVADLFLEKESPLLDWGGGLVSSKSKKTAIKVPLMVLVNGQTSAAAEALAAILRTKDRCLLLGSQTAGLAVMTTDFPLKNGQKLRIATAGVKLGNGDTLSSDGLSPDIGVRVEASAEKAFFADSYRDATPAKSILPSILGERPATNGTGSNAPAKSRPLNEAELMRERKERPGVDVDDLPLRSPSAKDSEPEKPVVRDPVLARAIDLAKGISALQKNTAP